MTADQKGHFIGNSFHAVAVARLLAGLVITSAEAKDMDVSRKLWDSWKVLEAKAESELQPWRARFGQGS